MKEVYVSVDIESDGPIPGPNSMLSLGAAAYSFNGDLLDTFSINLKTLEDAKGDPHTMAWWKKQPEAWKVCRENIQDPKKAMSDFVKWVDGLEGKPVFVGYPAGFDFLFVYWYLIKFVGRSPFSFSAIDIKTYAMAILKKPYRQSTKKNMPKRWFKDLPKHTHIAVDDAIEQGSLFCRMLNENICK